ncbi:MAG: HNH endonuclease [Clostridia bacterium]|nr:HNH endonuclease [Clostridia bacterium]
MNDRVFSDSVQYQVVLSNLEKNNGQLKCTLCGRILTSKSECHFDHILAYAKGGKSTFENCQILCIDCNLSKSDKQMHDFILEEKAKRFMFGETIDDPPCSMSQQLSNSDEKMTKEIFDMAVGEFIKKHGSIKRVDFTRDKNGLPSVIYITKYYGTMTQLKSAFGLKTDVVWNRENIWERLVEYSKINPEFRQVDLTKENELPSLPCILSYYPEYKNFTDIKLALGLDLNYELWTKEKVIAACKKYLASHSKITLKDLRKENGLPTSKVIYKYFGTMQRFQEEIGSEISKRQKFISKEEIMASTKNIIGKNGRVFESRNEFLEVFPYSLSVIIDRYGSFDSFICDADITILNAKKAKYTKQEVDDLILVYLKNGNPIPATAKELSALKLPSSSTIMRFYDTWKEPFELFSKMIDITKTGDVNK